jgi:hypothetical protein
VVCLSRCSDAYTDTLLGYANSIRTSDGGTHLDGMKAAITRTLNTLGRKSKALKVYCDLTSSVGLCLLDDVYQGSYRDLCNFIRVEFCVILFLRCYTDV